MRESVAAADLEALESEKTAATDSQALLDALNSGWDNNTGSAQRARRGAEETTSYCTFFGTQNFQGNPFGGPNKPAWEWAGENAIESVRIDREVQKYFLEVQRRGNKGNISTIEKTIDAAKDTKLIRIWENRFQKQRNEVARLVAIQRAEQLVKPNGALNFLEQKEPLLDRYQNDFWAAWLRLSAVARGLSELYKYEIDEEVFPKKEGDFLTYSDDKTELRINFDDIVTWAQLTNTWLAAFLEKQQQVTLSA